MGNVSSVLLTVVHNYRNVHRVHISCTRGSMLAGSDKQMWDNQRIHASYSTLQQPVAFSASVPGIATPYQCVEVGFRPRLIRFKISANYNWSYVFICLNGDVISE